MTASPTQKSDDFMWAEEHRRTAYGRRGNGTDRSLGTKGNAPESEGSSAGEHGIGLFGWDEVVRWAGK